MNTEQGLNAELTPEQLFAQMSDAVGSNDFTKINTLATDTAPLAGATEEPVIETPEVPEVLVPEVDPAKPVEDEPKDPPEGKTPDEPAKPVEEPAKPAEGDAATIAELRARLDKAEQAQHRFASDAGRFSALQRKLADVERKLADVASKPVTPASAREDTRVLSEKLAKIKDSDPALAEAVEDAIVTAINGLREEQQTARSEIETKLQSNEDEKHFEVEYQKLIAAEPNAPQVFKHPLWSEFKDTLTPARRAVAESSYAEDVIGAIREFAGYVKQTYPHLVPAQPEVKPSEPEVKPTVVDPVAERVKAERDKKLNTPTPGTGKNIAAPVTDNLDEAALFAKFYNEEGEKFKPRR